MPTIQNNPLVRSFNCDEHNPIMAAIDLGTNSCRLLVVRANVASIRTNYFRTHPRSNLWKVIDSYAKVIRLGEGLHLSSELSSAAIDRAMDALAVCKNKMQRYNISKTRIVATEACRRANNSNILVERAIKELGLNIEVIDYTEEANLAIKGCAAVLNSSIPYSIVFDIGGGSTEVIFVQLKKEIKRKPGYPVPFEVIDSVSIPHGVVTTSEAYNIANQEVILKAKNIISEEIQKFLQPFYEKNNIADLIAQEKLQILGSSGTVTTLAAMHLGLQQYERKLVDGLTISYEDLGVIINGILSNGNTPSNELHSTQGRTDYIVTGSIILQSLCLVFPMQCMRVADRGVREGILIDLIRDFIRM